MREAMWVCPWHKQFSCNKDMFYSLMSKDCIDWREIVYRISMVLIRRLSVRSEKRVKNAGPVCLVVDDTDFPKTGRYAEMFGRVYSHVAMRSVLGFKALFVGLTDGKTFTLLDSALHGEMGKNPHMPQGLSAGKRKFGRTSVAQFFPEEKHRCFQWLNLVGYGLLNMLRHPFNRQDFVL